MANAALESPRHLHIFGRPRVAILLKNRLNAELLGNLLSDGYEPAFEFSANADLCIVDGSSFVRVRERLIEERDRQRPVFFPVVFLTDRDDLTLRNPELWSVVDDVIHRPITKLELQARISSLMRARSLSIDLRALGTRYEQERRIAESLQEAAMPRNVPRVEGFAIATFYRAGSAESKVGGDWFDVFRVADGRVVVSIGDVAGSGLEAAITMSHVRQAIRGAAYVHAEPAILLEAADHLLESEAQRFVTAFVGILDHIGETFTYAGAGHPAAIVRSPEGELTELHTGDIPLGTGFKTERTSRDVPMSPGSEILLYTDGLIESEHDVPRGLARLYDAFRARAVRSGTNPARRLYDQLIASGRAPDDIAILTIRVLPHAANLRIRRWELSTSDAAEAHRIRDEIEKCLGPLQEEARFRFELVFSELVGNAVRHAPGRILIVLDTSSERPILNVVDRGPAFRHLPRLPDELLSECGRGLFLVDRLSYGFSVMPRRGGGSHARVVLFV